MANLFFNKKQSFKRVQEKRDHWIKEFDRLCSDHEDSVIMLDFAYGNGVELNSFWLGELMPYSNAIIGAGFVCNVKAANIGCSAKQMMQLMKRADTGNFNEVLEYDSKSHRKMAPKYGYYLEKDLTMIQVLALYGPLQNQQLDKDTEYLRDIVVFNVFSKKTTCAIGRSKSRIPPEQCADTVRDYFNKTIGRGGYYTLDAAINMIRKKGFNSNKEQRLINALRHVSQYRSIPNAKDKLNGKALENFKLSLVELHGMKINPVTVPKDWKINWHTNEHGIPYISNLLSVFYQELRVRDEPLEKWMKSHLARHSITTLSDKEFDDLLSFCK